MSKNKGVDLSGLDDFNPSSLISGQLKKPKEEGLLSYAPIEKFIEDENNARKSYDSQALEELINSMKVISEKTGKKVGVKQPLSVKKHPEKEGFFIINGGSRRYRAAKKIGLKKLPYFLSDNDSFDNVVDNLIRDGLKTEEVALFISERIKAGDKQIEIAERLGKTKSYVSDYALFDELPKSIKSLLNNRFCTSMQGLALLYRAYKKYEKEVDIFCNTTEKQLSTKILREFVDSLKAPESNTNQEEISIIENNDNNNEVDTDTDIVKNETPKNLNKKDNEEKGYGKNVNKKLVLLVEFENEQARLVFKNTLEYGKVIIKMESGETKEVNADQIKVLSIEED
ncbi:chromosome partitioning protein, ParB family [Bathymodiolus platifrons methanotrophic gill symbiont]|uniref:ParB/RepB/Spo0J family partition protein n=1 Tax=Bathymodiolus platifrons methanotrophic gill symbiont TaxID=113268 RepID=UPI000B418BEC|nr:ParB/RepB/Spo0J family partition protein [Bathymodiolus platifrons methanotrophic gill symbiont]GAW87316.1 chromosome partitioning protein, ParB family [Bathymodiolus platifrons methanotrophic gill symbiont]GFO76748.1 chromosome partitioning protein, ParB family [Bathymodiolus platifrons methanotrophic gill symbiont]